MIARIIALLLTLLVAGTVATACSTPESAVQTMVSVTPTATPSLPVCVVEDGAGQALCMWDAHRAGNGMGTDVVSGDCALTLTHDDMTQGMCLNVHHDGVDGPDAVRECNDIYEQAKGKVNLLECYRAML